MTLFRDLTKKREAFLKQADKVIRLFVSVPKTLLCKVNLAKVPYRFGTQFLRVAAVEKLREYSGQRV